jgi:adenine-specific DNA-methyltransferase
MDANALDTEELGLDLVYLDPPYNQHPYGSNYFMLNLLVNYQEPTDLSRVSGIPSNWRRSRYNVGRDAFICLRQLLMNTRSKFILISFNDEGFIQPGDMRDLLQKLGTVTEFKVPYNTFRGSRNLRNRKIHVTEHLYLLRKGC